MTSPATAASMADYTYQTRPLDDGSWHEVLKNFPTPNEALAMLGARACDPRWTAFTHYWILSYHLT